MPLDAVSIQDTDVCIQYTDIYTHTYIHTYTRDTCLLCISIVCSRDMRQLKKKSERLAVGRAQLLRKYRSITDKTCKLLLLELIRITSLPKAARKARRITD